MNRAVAVAALAFVGAAPPAARAPVASYWVDAATASGFGAGMTAGARPNMGQIMRAMQGGGGAQHTLELRLASKQRPTGAPSADHLPPPGLAMGPRLPLVSPTAAAPARETPPGMPGNFQRPQGRMLIYWGCGEHVGPNQPMVLDFAKLTAGQMPPGMRALANGYGHADPRPGPNSAPGYGEWPNNRDSRPVPAQGSLVGAHRVEGNYSPPIAFSLAPGQDFMPALGLAEAGGLPSGAARLAWRPTLGATGYALAMFGAGGNGSDVLMWTSSQRAAMMTVMDYLPPAEVRRMITTGAVLPPSTTECLLPAEVARAAPAGVISMIGYGPEAFFSDAPRTPKWTARVRYKTTATLMRGMPGMEGATGSDQPQQQRRRRRFGIGDVLKSVSPVPIP